MATNRRPDDTAETSVMGTWLWRRTRGHATLNNETTNTTDDKTVMTPLHVPPSRMAVAGATACVVLACGASLWAGYRLRPRVRQLQRERWHRRERRQRNPSWLLPSFTLVPAKTTEAAVESGIPSRLWTRLRPHARQQRSPPLLRESWRGAVCQSPERLVPAWAALVGPRWASRACETNLTRVFRPVRAAASPDTPSVGKGTTIPVGEASASETGAAAVPASTQQATAAPYPVTKAAAVTKRGRGRPRKAKASVTPQPDPAPVATPVEAPAADSSVASTTTATITVKRRKIAVATVSSATSSGGEAVPPPSGSFLRSFRRARSPLQTAAPLVRCEVPVAAETTSAASPANTLFILQKQTFTTLYHAESRSPVWCGYYLTALGAARAGRQHRFLSYFSDPVLPRAMRRTPGKFRKAGYDRGHLAPHAAVATTERAALESAMLTNIALQDSFLNRRVWRKLEALPRAYVSAASPGSEEHVDAQLLRHLFEAQAKMERVPQRLRPTATSRTRVSPDKRQLAICTGPLFSATADAVRCRGRPPGSTNTSTVTRKGKGTRRAARQIRNAAATAKQASTLPLTGKAAAPAASTNEPPLRVPSSFFMVVWDTHTHEHVALVVPNRKDAHMEVWEAMTDASSPRSAHTPVTAVGRGSRKKKTRGRPSAVSAAKHEKRTVTTPVAAGITQANAGADAERWLHLFQHYIVPLSDVEEAFMASTRYLASSCPSDTTMAAVNMKGPPKVTPQPDSYELHAHFFPVFQKRRRLRTWWPRLFLRVQRLWKGIASPDKEADSQKASTSVKTTPLPLSSSSPEGNPLCVVGWHGRRLRPSRTEGKPPAGKAAAAQTAEAG